MIFLSPNLPSTAHYLALEELLLERFHDQPDLPGTLLMWEPSETCVVIGLGNRIKREVHVEHCHQDSVPVYRRISGGGAVVQGEGSLNYSLILPINQAPELATVTGTNTYIMNRVASALSLPNSQKVTVRGHTDLVIEEKKVAGNSQKRSRNALIFHGTLLLSMDLKLVSRLLPQPSREPDYRSGRNHDAFVTHLSLSQKACISALRSEWNAAEEADYNALVDRGQIDSLAKERYLNNEWSERI